MHKNFPHRSWISLGWPGIMFSNWIVVWILWCSTPVKSLLLTKPDAFTCVQFPFSLRFLINFFESGNVFSLYSAYIPHVFGKVMTWKFYDWPIDQICIYEGAKHLERFVKLVSLGRLVQLCSQPCHSSSWRTLSFFLQFMNRVLHLTVTKFETWPIFYQRYTCTMHRNILKYRLANQEQ